MGSMMDAGAALNSALRSFGYPVGRPYVKKNPAHTFFRFMRFADVPKLFADDDNEYVESFWRIDLFTKHDYLELLPKVIATVKAAGFYGVHTGAEQYEHDTGLYHISLDAKYLEE